MKMAFGINTRAVGSWVRKAAKKDTLHISRRDGKVMFSDGRVIVILPTVAAWDVIKALPVPIPEADGNYRIMYGSMSTDGADISAVIKRETDVTGKGVRAHDTRLSWRIPNEDRITAHLYYIPTGPDGVCAAYAVIDETYARLFEDYTEIRVSKNRRVNERSNTLTSPISYYVGDELVGLVLPIYTDYLPEYLRLDVLVTDVVAD